MLLYYRSTLYAVRQPTDNIPRRDVMRILIARNTNGLLRRTGFIIPSVAHIFLFWIIYR